MADYPAQVQQFHDALSRLRGVVEVNTGIKRLDQIAIADYAQPGKLGDLPHALLRRTNGGLPQEAWANTDIILSYDRAGWLCLEFLAWWVRQLSRGGELIQLRPLALAPEAAETGEIQLGTTLKFVIDHLGQVGGAGPQPMLELLGQRAAALNQALEQYDAVLGDLLHRGADIA